MDGAAAAENWPLELMSSWPVPRDGDQDGDAEWDENGAWSGEPDPGMPASDQNKPEPNDELAAAALCGGLLGCAAGSSAAGGTPRRARAAPCCSATISAEVRASGQARLRLIDVAIAWVDRYCRSSGLLLTWRAAAGSRGAPLAAWPS